MTQEIEIIIDEPIVLTIGAQQALPDSIVLDENYVHTDNNYTDADKNKVANALTSETDPTVPSWAKQPSKPSYNKSEIGLGNVDNTSDANKPISTATQTALNNKLNSSAVSLSAGQVGFGSGSNTIGGDNGLYWDNSNKRLGIGTTNPAYTLDVNGIARVGDILGSNTSQKIGFSRAGNYIDFIPDSSASKGFMSISNSNTFGTNDLFLQFQPIPGANAIFESYNSPFYLATKGTTQPIIFATDRIEKMRITGYGNVGIGTTTPSEKLDVVGNGKFSGTLQIGAYTLPSTDGTSNQVLKTNGSGSLSWQKDDGILLTSLSASAPLSYNNGTGAFSISQANGSTNGYLSSTDWNTFNNKQATINGAATTITSSNLTNDRALISNGSGKVDVSTVTSTELGYISGVTSSIQTQLNSKQASIGFTPENVTNKKTTLTDNSDTFYPTQKAVKTAVDAKQDTLVSGTNIKTINGTSVLGSGNLTVDGLPAQAGKNGKYLKTDGANASWEDAAGPPGPTYASIAANSTTVTSNTTCVIDKFYVADSESQITFTLPSIAAEGSLIGIAAKNVGGFKVATGGYLMIDGFNLGDDYLECPQYSTIIIRCVEVNTGWVIESYAGKLYNLGYSRYFTHIPAITSDTNTNLISTALSYTTSGSPADNVFMSKSGKLVGTNNVVIGERSLVSHSGTCTSSVIIGSTAGYIGGDYTNITAVGMQAALRVFTSSWSSYFGKGAGRYSSNHYYSIFIGAESGDHTNTISYSFILGFQTAYGASNITNGFIVSTHAGFGINGSNNDIIIGSYAGRYLTGTSHNILIGYNAGSECAGNATGNYNVIIGTNVTLPDGTNNGLNIGGVLFGTGLNDDTSGDPKHNPTSTGKIGIGTNAPNGVLDVVSTTNGSLPFPRMTASQRTAISSPSVGTHVYQTDGTEGVYVYKSGGWAFAY